MKKQHKVLVLGMVVILALQLCMSIYAQPNGATESSKSIVEVLKKSNKQFVTLTKALDAAGLTSTLEGTGPYTLFAPTDRAFEQLPKGALDELLKSSNKDKLVDILMHHVAEGKLSAEEIAKLNGQELTMFNGQPAKIEVKDGAVFIDGARILKTDIETSNGVIHIIDMVIMP